MIGLLFFWKCTMPSRLLHNIRIEVCLNLRFTPDINLWLNRNICLGNRWGYISINFISRCKSFDKGFIGIWIRLEISLLLLAGSLVTFFWSICTPLIAMVIWNWCLVLYWSAVTGFYIYYFLRLGLSGCHRFLFLAKATVLLSVDFIGELYHRAG